MTLGTLAAQCYAILPELILSLALCAVILADMLVPFKKSRAVCGTISIVGAALALLVFIMRLNPAAPAVYPTFNGMIVHDQLRAILGIILLAGSIFIFLFSMRSRETAGYRQGEYFTLLLGAVFGTLLLVSADNFILFILGLETLSLCSYILAGFVKHERASAEASLKYMIYGAVVSGILLFGLSYVYGLTGTLSIGAAFNKLLMSTAAGFISPMTVVLVLALVLVGVGFKIAMVPFHFWCPDVYQGSPTPITAFLAVVSKTAGFGALLRLLLPLFGISTPTVLTHQALPILFGVLAVITMTYGNLVAIRQTDIKRLLAYSSIAHAGYLLMPMAVYSADAVQAMIFYLFIYLFMNLGAFWVVIALINRFGSAQIDRFRGAAYQAPFLFSAMFLFLISLTGLPPTAGFVGKFMLFKVVISAAISAFGPGGTITPMAAFYLFVAMAGLINSAISLYYYMKIAKAMAFDKPEKEISIRDNWGDAIYASMLAVPVLALLYFEPVLQLLKLGIR